MADRRELWKRRAANALRRRIRRYQLRIFILKRLELAVQRIVFGVRNGRRIEHVIIVIVRFDRLAQRDGTFLRRGRDDGGAHLRRHCRHRYAPNNASARALPGSI